MTAAPEPRTDTTTLTAWLLDRIAEDEAVARAVPPLGHVFDMGGSRLDERWYVSRQKFSSADGAARSDQDIEATQLFARQDPARVLAECAAKRRVIAFAQTLQGGLDVFYSEKSESWIVERQILRSLAAVYADHEGYRAEWRA